MLRQEKFFHLAVTLSYRVLIATFSLCVPAFESDAVAAEGTVSLSCELEGGVEMYYSSQDFPEPVVGNVCKARKAATRLCSISCRFTKAPGKPSIKSACPRGAFPMNLPKTCAAAVKLPATTFTRYLWGDTSKSCGQLIAQHLPGRTISQICGTATWYADFPCR